MIRLIHPCHNCTTSGKIWKNQRTSRNNGFSCLRWQYWQGIRFQTEITREADQQNPRILAMMGNLEEEPAKRKVTILLYISIGKTGRKMLMHKFQQIIFLLIQLAQLLRFCIECFQTRRNRTLTATHFCQENRRQLNTSTNFGTY